MGVFIYEAEGDIPDTLKITGIDVIPMAKGSTAEVGYVTTPELIETLCDLNYEEKKRGLIHSHVNMGTNFSGTDVDVLEGLAENQPYYLSVVVNNKLDVTAKIAYKVREKVQLFFKNLKNEDIHINEEVDRVSYRLQELSVKFDVPQYLARVLPSFNNIQNYNKAAYDNFEKTGRHEVPKYKSPGYGYQGKGHGQNGDGYKHSSKAPVQVNAAKDRQISMFNDLEYDECELSEEELGNIVPDILDSLIEMYPTISELASAILIDKDGTGLHITDFIGYLTVYNHEALGKDKGYPDRLLNTLKSYVTKDLMK